MVGGKAQARVPADAEMVPVKEIRIAAFFPRSSPFSQAKGRNRLNQKKMAYKIEVMHHKKYQVFQENADTLIEMVGQGKWDTNGNVMVYWQLGEYMAREYRANRDNPAYIDFFITSLSADTRMSKTTLMAMKRFYTLYPLAAHISSALSWAHYLLLIDIPDDEKRMFYQRMAVDRAWTPRELDQAIRNQLYEKKLETNNRVTRRMYRPPLTDGWV